ncbi:hypothetical protein B0180_06615 [Moraxella canis]|uniref:Uncharacterized protein n=1 Tax=Moraxella canis TaxID=90239 RepID=A0A1S9ZIB4_9GAMM|nr:hypothetical protein B0180_06615 [Moraxella canis]
MLQSSLCSFAKWIFGIYTQCREKMSEYSPIKLISCFGRLYTISSVWMVVRQQYSLFFVKIKD